MARASRPEEKKQTKIITKIVQIQNSFIALTCDVNRRQPKVPAFFEPSKTKFFLSLSFSLSSSLSLSLSLNVSVFFDFFSKKEANKKDKFFNEDTNTFLRILNKKSREIK